MNSPRDLVTHALANVVTEISNLTKIPVEINPEKTLSEVKLAAQSALDGQKQSDADEIAATRGRITELTREITTIEVAPVDQYKDGGTAVISCIDGSKVNIGPAEVASHLHQQAQRVKGITFAMNGMRAEAIFALCTGLFLAFVGALGVIQPMMMKAMGDNGDPANLGTVVWVVIVASAIALTIGAVNVTFFRPVTTRLAPWKAILVGVAIFFLAGRYVASAMNADFMLMQDMPPPVQIAIRILESMGIAVALICVELGSGRCFAFFWLRFQQTRTDSPRLEQLQQEIQEWSRLRAKDDARIQNAAQPIKVEDLERQAALIVTETIDAGLAPHREVLRRDSKAIDQPWAGSAHEHIDVAWLTRQVAACESARDTFLRIAGLQPPGASTSPVTSPTPPLPLPIAITP